MARHRSTLDKTEPMMAQKPCPGRPFDPGIASREALIKAGARRDDFATGTDAGQQPATY